MPPGFCRIGSTGLSPLVTAVTTEKLLRFSLFADSRSAMRIIHGKSVRASGGRGAPPLPGWRKKAIFRPSDDQAGNESREVDGAIKRIGRSGLNSPMKL